MATRRRPHIETFALRPGRVLGGDYVVQSLLGSGWEGEVYKVTERRTGAARAAKLFFPQRNEKDRAVDFYARKLERLRDCPLLIRYHHAEVFRHQGRPVTALISEFVDGAILENLIAKRRGRGLHEYEALHILYALVQGVEQIHARRDYHGDLHIGNVLVRRRGVHFDVKLVDLFNHGRATVTNLRSDVIECIRILYDMLGGQRRYARQRPEIKYICAGLQHTRIGQRFPTASVLREHLESFDWAEE